MKLSMKIRAHEAEVLVVGTEEEQTAEITRIMLQAARPRCRAGFRPRCREDFVQGLWPCPPPQHPAGVHGAGYRIER